MIRAFKHSLRMYVCMCMYLQNLCSCNLLNCIDFDGYKSFKNILFTVDDYINHKPCPLHPINSAATNTKIKESKHKML